MAEPSYFVQQATAELRNIVIEARALEERIRLLERQVQRVETVQEQWEALHVLVEKLNTIVREEDGQDASSLLGRIKNLERWRLDAGVLHNSRSAWWSKLLFEVLKWAVLLALGGAVTWTLTKMGKP